MGPGAGLSALVLLRRARGVDLLRRDPEQSRDLFDDDVLDDHGEFLEVTGPGFHRAPIDHNPVPTIRGPRVGPPERGDLLLPGRGVDRRNVLDGEVDVPPARTQAGTDPLGGIEDEVVENLPTRAHRRNRGPGEWSAEPTTVPAAHRWCSLRTGRMLRRADGAMSAPWPRVASVTVARTCSKTGCPRPAVATLTYVYADRAVVLGRLATYAEPHAYDLCSGHAVRLTVPRGWDVVRLIDELPDQPARRSSEPEDDLFDLAAVLRPAPLTSAAAPAPSAAQPAPGDELGRRGHLRVLRGHRDA